MNLEAEAGLRALLEPTPEEVEKVVAAALKGTAPRPPRLLALMVAAGSVAVLALLGTYAAHESSFTELMPVAPTVEGIIQVSNSGSVILIKKPSGRTLIANRAPAEPGTGARDSYRLMISKGTVP
jgi:hypothetical protein